MEGSDLRRQGTGTGAWDTGHGSRNELQLAGRWEGKAGSKASTASKQGRKRKADRQSSRLPFLFFTFGLDSANLPASLSAVLALMLLVVVVLPLAVLGYWRQLLAENEMLLVHAPRCIPASTSCFLPLVAALASACARAHTKPGLVWPARMYWLRAGTHRRLAKYLAVLAKVRWYLWVR